MMRRYGIAFLFISHDLAVIQHVSDTIAVMYLGKLVEQAPAFTLYARPRPPYTQALLSAIPHPDPRSGKQRIVLEGEVPSALHPPSGCAFRTRCPRAQALCATAAPALQPAADEHLVACHFAD
mgnify:CR=1 FL=1